MRLPRMVEDVAEPVLEEPFLDALERPRAARVLRLLAQRETMTQREFAEASRHSPEQAKALREALERAGILVVRTLPGHGRAGVKEIRLSAAGRAIAQHLAAVAEIARSLAHARLGEPGPEDADGLGPNGRERDDNGLDGAG